MDDGQSILKTSLLDLLHELRDEDPPLILGGGYGLFLKQIYLQSALDAPTLIDGNLWPAPRATEDLDFLLRTEVVIDADRMRPIRKALELLSYTVVHGAEYMQFVKPLGDGRFVKVDLLTGPLGDLAGDPRVRIDNRRVWPRQSVKLHAHRTDEALGFQDNTTAIPVEGLLSSDEPYKATIHVPSAFTLLLMKLYAFRDRCQNEEKDLARCQEFSRSLRLCLYLSHEPYNSIIDEGTQIS